MLKVSRKVIAFPLSSSHLTGMALRLRYTTEIMNVHLLRPSKHLIISHTSNVGDVIVHVKNILY